MADAIVDASGNVHMTSPTGQAVKIAPDELQKAYAAGYQLASAGEVNHRELLKERGTPLEATKALGESAAAGATLGLSDVAGAAISPEWAAASRERREVNPTASTIGEIGGAVGGALLTGGESLAARGLSAGARATGAAGRVAGGLARGAASVVGLEGRSAASRLLLRGIESGAAGAAEGALYGAGMAASKASLEGTDITAEKLLAGAGEGALFGGAAGAGGAVLAEGVSAVGRRIPKGFLGKQADAATLRVAGANKRDLGRLGKTVEQTERRVSEMAEDLRSYRFKEGPNKGEKLWSRAGNPEELAGALTQAKGETGAALGAARKQIDDAIASARVQKAEMAAVDPVAAEAIVGPAPPDVDKMFDRIETEVLTDMKASLLPDVRRQASRVEKTLGDLRARDAAAKAGAPGIEPVGFTELETFRQQLADVVYPKPPAGGGVPAPVPEHHRALQKVERIAADTIDESAEAALATMGQDMAPYLELKRQYGSLSKLESMAQRAAKDEATKAVSVSMGEYLTGMGSAIGALASGNVGVLGVGAAGLIGKRVLSEYGDRAIANLAHAVRGVDEVIDGAAKALVSGNAGAVARKGVTVAALRERYDSIRDSIREDRENPTASAATLARMTAPYDVEYPTLAGAVQQRAMMARGVVASSLPTPVTRATNSLTPEHEDSTVSVPEISKALRRIRGVLDAQGVIQDLSAGRLDVAGMEALKQSSPQLYQQLRERVIVEAAQQGNTIPFRRRIMLGVAFDFPSDFSLTPAGIQALQIAVPPPPPETSPPAGTPKPDTSLLTPNQQETTL
jgi:hypothetical protein